jgi:ribonuclease BN (tRNA processing enzyme)
MAERAEVGRLVLTHVPAWHSRDQVLAEAAPRFSGESSLAVVGARYDI